MQRFRTQAPGDRLDHPFMVPLATGESLTGTPVVVASPPTVTIEATAIAEGRVIVWISGGVPETDYALTATVTTTMGRTIVMTASLHVGPVGLDDPAQIGATTA